MWNKRHHYKHICNRAEQRSFTEQGQPQLLFENYAPSEGNDKRQIPSSIHSPVTGLILQSDFQREKKGYPAS